jgi:hypothetical protein
MCYANPTKSLELNRARMTPEAWAKFEADFEHFCAYSGLVETRPYGHQFSVMDWAKWAYFAGQGL